MFASNTRFSTHTCIFRLKLFLFRHFFLRNAFSCNFTDDCLPLNARSYGSFPHFLYLYPHYERSSIMMLGKADYTATDYKKSHARWLKYSYSQPWGLQNSHPYIPFNVRTSAIIAMPLNSPGQTRKAWRWQIKIMEKF